MKLRYRLAPCRTAACAAAVALAGGCHRPRPAPAARIVARAPSGNMSRFGGGIGGAGGAAAIARVPRPGAGDDAFALTLPGLRSIDLPVLARPAAERLHPVERWGERAFTARLTAAETQIIAVAADGASVWYRAPGVGADGFAPRPDGTIAAVRRRGGRLEILSGRVGGRAAVRTSLRAPATRGWAYVATAGQAVWVLARGGSAGELVWRRADGDAWSKPVELPPGAGARPPLRCGARSAWIAFSGHSAHLLVRFPPAGAPAIASAGPGVARALACRGRVAAVALATGRLLRCAGGHCRQRRFSGRLRAVEVDPGGRAWAIVVARAGAAIVTERPGRKSGRWRLPRSWAAPRATFALVSAGRTMYAVAKHPDGPPPARKTIEVAAVTLR